MHGGTWQLTFTCCLKVTVASFVPQALDRALFQEHTTATVTGSSAATGLRLWNSLPSHLQRSDIGQNNDLKRQLKTFLFAQTAAQHSAL